mmetsp:Transcript_66055/g.178574  ORF Transcript_66055/g.178574 Transcript_66055/m.178574 type:complete len:381 (+) Transcript_66055:317-1459(+)
MFAALARVHHRVHRTEDGAPHAPVALRPSRGGLPLDVDQLLIYVGRLTEDVVTAAAMADAYRPPGHLAEPNPHRDDAGGRKASQPVVQLLSRLLRGLERQARQAVGICGVPRLRLYHAGHQLHHELRDPGPRMPTENLLDRVAEPMQSPDGPEVLGRRALQQALQRGDGDLRAARVPLHGQAHLLDVQGPRAGPAPVAQEAVEAEHGAEHGDVVGELPDLQAWPLLLLFLLGQPRARVGRWLLHLQRPIAGRRGPLLRGIRHGAARLYLGRPPSLGRVLQDCGGTTPRARGGPVPRARDELAPKRGPVAGQRQALLVLHQLQHLGGQLRTDAPQAEQDVQEPPPQVLVAQVPEHRAYQVADQPWHFAELRRSKRPLRVQV